MDKVNKVLVGISAGVSVFCIGFGIRSIINLYRQEKCLYECRERVKKCALSQNKRFGEMLEKYKIEVKRYKGQDAFQYEKFIPVYEGALKEAVDATNDPKISGICIISDEYSHKLENKLRELEYINGTHKNPFYMLM